VNDNDFQHSGSRWEPRPGHADAAGGEPDRGDAPTAVLPSAVGTGRESSRWRGTAARMRRTGGRRTRRGLLAGAGIGLSTVAVVGGYAVSHAVATNAHTPPSVVRTGTSGDAGAGETQVPDGHRGRHGDGVRPGFGDAPPAAGDGAASDGQPPSTGAAGGNA
jgi:hypothetical protein